MTKCPDCNKNIQLKGTGCACDETELATPPVATPPARGDVPEWVAAEIRETWKAARDAGGEMQAFRIIERMTDRLGYGRRENNPPLPPNNIIGGITQTPKKP